MSKLLKRKKSGHIVILELMLPMQARDRGVNCYSYSVLFHLNFELLSVKFVLLQKYFVL